MHQAYVLYSGKVDIVNFWLDDVIIYKTGQETFLCFCTCANFFFFVVVLTPVDQKNIVAQNPGGGQVSVTILRQ